MSADLAARIQLGLDELAGVRNQMDPSIARINEPDLPFIETAAACAMLHSFYMEIEKIFKLIAMDFDGREAVAGVVASRPADGDEPADGETTGLVTRLAELLAFRHLFRVASIALMRWNKLSVLMEKVGDVSSEVVRELARFQGFLRQGRVGAQV